MEARGLALDLSVRCVVVPEATPAAFGALMERMVVFFCREKGLGVSRGLGGTDGLGAPIWDTSKGLSITESLEEGSRVSVNMQQDFLFKVKKSFLPT